MRVVKTTIDAAEGVTEFKHSLQHMLHKALPRGIIIDISAEGMTVSVGGIGRAHAMALLLDVIEFMRDETIEQLHEIVSEDETEGHTQQ